MSDFALVERCSCGAVHVTIGAVTLRLQASSIAPLAETMSTAARALAFEGAFGGQALPSDMLA